MNSEANTMSENTVIPKIYIQMNNNEQRNSEKNTQNKLPEIKSKNFYDMWTNRIINKEFGVVFIATQLIKQSDFLDELTSKIDPDDIFSYGRSGHKYFVYFTSEKIAQSILQKTIICNNIQLTAQPIIKKPTKLILSNVLPHIPEESIIEFLQKYGNLTSNYLKPIPINTNGNHKLKHIISHRREISIHLKSNIKLPEKIILCMDEESYEISVSTISAYQRKQNNNQNTEVLQIPNISLNKQKCNSNQQSMMETEVFSSQHQKLNIESQIPKKENHSSEDPNKITRLILSEVSHYTPHEEIFKALEEFCNPVKDSLKRTFYDEYESKDPNYEILVYPIPNKTIKSIIPLKDTDGEEYHAIIYKDFSCETCKAKDHNERTCPKLNPRNCNLRKFYEEMDFSCSQTYDHQESPKKQQKSIPNIQIPTTHTKRTKHQKKKK